MLVAKIGLVSISDRASRGVYTDAGIPALSQWLSHALSSPFVLHTALIADEELEISNTLCHLVDELACHLILTTGGTGPALRDVTPEATLSVADKTLPGIAEQMRQISLHFVPTAVLSRQVAVIRKQCLIVNLPGQPKSIVQILEGVKNNQGEVLIKGIFSAIPYCLDLLASADSAMPYLETHAHVVEAFRPNRTNKPAA